MMEQMKPSGIDWIGDIPSKWNIGKIKHFYCLQTGFTPDTTVSEYYDDNGSDWVNISDMDTATHYIIETKYKISDRYLAEKHPKIVPEGSLLYSFKLSVGKVAFSGKDIYTNEAIASFLDSKDVNLGFLYYSSSLIIENANINIYGAKILNQELISNAPIIFPSIEEQQAIANYLDRECAQIDSIVADLEKQIALLQQYKKSLITETVTKGLDKSVPMKDSGVEWIGKIPEHWDVEPIKYRVTFHNGDRGENYPSKSELQSEGIPFINAGHLEGDGLNMDNMDYISEEKYRIMGGVKLRPGDILYCLRGSVGKNAIVDMNQGTVASSLVAIRSVRILAEYLYYCLNSHIEEVQRYLWDNGTAQPNLSADNLGKYKFCIPPVEEQKAIVKYLNNICSQIDNLVIGKKKQLSTIQQHKKSLIYEYVTGKKRVKEVQ